VLAFVHWRKGNERSTGVNDISFSAGTRSELEVSIFAKFAGKEPKIKASRDVILRLRLLEAIKGQYVKLD
jgi:hypothetical protein